MRDCGRGEGHFTGLGYAHATGVPFTLLIHAQIQRGDRGPDPPPLRFVRGGVLCRWFMGRRGGPKVVFILLLWFFLARFARQYCYRENVWTIIITSKFQFPSPISYTRYPWLLWKCISMFILFKITRFKRKKIWGRTPRPPPLQLQHN